MEASKWYKEQDPYSSLNQYVSTLKSKQAYKEELDARHERLYGGISGLSISNSVTPQSLLSNKLSFNLIQSMIDTLTSKIGKNKPKVTFLTDNGDWSQQQQAKKLEAFIYGLFYKNKVYDKGMKSLLDTCVFGDGFMKVTPNLEERDVRFERVSPQNLMVDDMDSIYGTPKTIIEIRYVDKELLKEIYPDKAGYIETAKTPINPFYSSLTFSNLVEVIEVFKVSSSKKAKNGRHVIVIENQTLVDEEYHSTRFPYARLGYSPSIKGYWHRGVAEIITPHQVELNKVLMRAQEALKFSSPKILYDYTSKIVKTHFNDEIGSMIGFQGGTTPPQYINPTMVNPEIMNYMLFIKSSALEDLGLSQMSVSGTKPAGLNSGKALREFSDIETERFARFSQSWENFYIDICELAIDSAKVVANKFGKFEVLSPDNTGAELIDFKKVDLEQSAYVMQPYPTNLLSKTPAGRLEDVQDLIAAQMLTPEEGLSLLEFPDLKKITKFKNSPMDDIYATIDHMITKGEYLPPEPFQKLDMGITLMQSSYLYYKNRKVAQEKLDLLQRWVNDAFEMKNMTAPTEIPGADISNQIAGSEPQADMGGLEELTPELNEEIAADQEIINPEI